MRGRFRNFTFLHSVILNSMTSRKLHKNTQHKKTPVKHKQVLKDRVSTIAASSAQTLKTQIPTIAAIIFTEIIIAYSPTSGTYNLIIIVLLGAVIYTAMHAGLRQGLVAAITIVLYNYYLIVSITGLSLFNPAVLQSGAVIGIAFPLLAIIVGRLKDRNDALLEREKGARRKAEDSERQLRFMAESMPQKIFTIKPDGGLDYVNPQWDEYTSNPGDSGSGGDWALRIHPDDIAENKALWEHSLKTGEPFQYEHRLQHGDGQYVWHLTRARALRNDEGKIISWIGSSTDIEDVRRTRKLELATARLTKQRAELMELNVAKDEFISLASHQLRTPATGVKQYVGMALEGYGGKITAKLRTFLQKANESNERQLSVINDLLQVAQVDAGQVILRKEAVNAGQLIKGVVQEQHAKFSKRHQTVHFDARKSKLAVDADPIKLRMVVENIIDNASKYTPDGKSITIRLSRSGDTARIAFKDEGVGIAREDIDKVFQKFLRLDNPMSAAVGGSGLGLYWVRKIIDLHGGHITVTSKMGKGTTFTVTLPLTDGEK